MRVSEVLDAYTIQLRGDGRSVHTIKQARRFGKKLVASLGDPPIEQVRHEDLAGFFASDCVLQRADGKARRANRLRFSGPIRRAAWS